MKKIVMTGGGTAGHVTPNIALMPALRSEGYEISYIGSYEGIEKGLIEAQKVPYYGISSGKLRRYFDVKNFSDPFKVIKGYYQSIRLLKKIKPDVVFSKGGFVSVPVVLAAKHCKIPAIIHESDITPGLANKLAIPSATKVCCNFPETMKYLPEGKAVLTGSPIRQELLNGNPSNAIKLCHFENTEKPVILIIGGSTGSRAINTAIRDLLPELHYIMEKILILDFGSQYTQLIARRVRELNVYCEIHPFNKIPVPDASVRGVILSGSPFSVRDEHAPAPDLSAIKGKLPLLGVCYGAQFLASAFGGEVQPAPSREYGRAVLTVGDAGDPLMRGLPATTQVWMSHGDTITSVPANYKIVASTEDVRVAAFRIEGEQTWGIQFHPEVYHSTDGTHLLKNFVAGICGCRQEWTSESFVEATVRELQEKLGDDKVVLGLSGGVDSSVAAVLLHRQEESTKWHKKWENAFSQPC